MANDNTDPKQPNEPDTQPDAVPGRPGLPADEVNMPTNPRQDTEKAAESAIKTSESRDFTASVEKGADKDFNTWLRKAHENGNPEQLTPMQAEQNIRDKRKDEPVVSELHDLGHEDTRWVVQNVLGEQLPANS